jgi:hypothetical protein
MLWTSVGISGGGVSDPDPVEAAPGAKNCNVSPVKAENPNARELLSCDMGTIEIEGQNDRLDATYYSDQAKYFPSNDLRAQNLCSTPSDLCATELHIRFDMPGDSTDDSLRMAIPHFSSAIVGAHIAGDALLVNDANGQTWRYLVGIKPILSLLQARWQGLSSNDVKEVQFSNPCKRMECEKVPIPGWPQ